MKKKKHWPKPQEPEGFCALQLNFTHGMLRQSRIELALAGAGWIF